MDVKILILKCFSLLILYFNTVVEGEDSRYGMCANQDCSQPISIGSTTLRYISPDDSKISVEPNEDVVIYVKDYGPKKDLWGIIVRGNRGYISKNFIKETKLLSKNLVPAFFEFRTSILVTNSFTVSSHLHVASHPPQADNTMSGAVFQSGPHMHTVLHDSINSVPNTMQQQQWNGDSERSHFHSSQLHPTQNEQFNSYSTFDHSSQLHNVPEQSSHFYPDYGNSFYSDMTDTKPEIILPSPTHKPGEKYTHSSHPSPDESVLTSPFGSSINDVPNSGLPHNGLPVLNIPSPGQGFQNQHLPNTIGQQAPSSHVPGIQSNSYSSDYFDDEDFSKTYSMLSSMGVDNIDLYDNLEVHVEQPSQNSESKIDLSTTDFSPKPSHSQSSSFQDSSASDFPTINPNLQEKSVEREKGLDEVPPKEDTETNNEPAEKAVHNKKDSENIKIDDNANEEDYDYEVFAEEDADDDSSDDEDEGAESSLVEDSILSSKTVDLDNAVKVDLQPSMSPTEIDEHTPKKHTYIPSSDSAVADFSSVSPPLEYTVPVKQDKTEIMLENSVTSDTASTVIQLHETDKSSNEFASSKADFVQQTEVQESTVGLHSTTQSSVLENSVDHQINPADSLNTTNEKLENVSALLDELNSVVNKISEGSNEVNISIPAEAFPKNDDLSNIPDRNNNDVNSGNNDKELNNPKINDFFIESEQNSEIINTIDIDGVDDLTTYQGRNLKGEFGTTEEQQSDSDGSNDENNTQSESDSYNSFGNWFDALKALIDSAMSWIPEPLYSALMNLQSKGISPRVPVFTTLCGFISIFLIVPIYYIKEWSKENKLSAQLASVEKKAYELSATNIILEEKLESAQAELANLQALLTEERSVSENIKSEHENQADLLESAKAEVKRCLEDIEALKEKQNEYLTRINDLEKERENYEEHKEALDKIMKEQESNIISLTDNLQESEKKLQEIGKEKEELLQLKEDYEEKLAQFDRNCNQLLQEAEVWNLRVNELTEKVSEEQTIKEEIAETLKTKEEEIESLKELVETFKIFDEIEDPEEQAKAKEEKLQSLLNNTMIINQLKKEEEKNKLLDEQLGIEKNKLLEIEVELLEAKSEIDKLKLSYNQALQDKAEAQTKLEVLTNYFKDKEIQLQKQLGAQEAVRQKKEEDANSAERRISLIEQENASYKFQVASMKQEMEETERTLKSQIAVQEKKAHENWIAARAAERKLEEMKQEVTQLRQRLTLLEREQENWMNAPRDEIIRPVPKRMNDESGSQDLNVSERGMFPPPPLHDRLPPPPMMLPPDRPLPPLLPPPPMFLHPMERHFRPPQPWHMPPDHSSDYRNTPEFIGGRELTPPRGRPSAITDGDVAPHTSSPLTTDTRDSRNSTPPHLLPDFHDVPPQPGRPFYLPPPQLGRPRFPMPPPYRRDAGPEHKRSDNLNEFNSREPPPSSERWQNSRV